VRNTGIFYVWTLFWVALIPMPRSRLFFLSAVNRCIMVQEFHYRSYVKERNFSVTEGKNVFVDWSRENILHMTYGSCGVCVCVCVCVEWILVQTLDIRNSLAGRYIRLEGRIVLKCRRVWPKLRRVHLLSRNSWTKVGLSDVLCKTEINVCL